MERQTLGQFLANDEQSITRIVTMICNAIDVVFDVPDKEAARRKEWVEEVREIVRGEMLNGRLDHGDVVSEIYGMAMEIGTRIGTGFATQHGVISRKIDNNA